MSLVPQDWSARERQRARRTLRRRHPEQAIDADLCAAIRQRAVDGATSADLRREIDAAAQTIRRHLRGLCDCDHDVAPVAWDATTQQWVREELADGDDELVADGGRDLVDACPECDHVEIRIRGSTQFRDLPWRVGDERFRCKQCGATFDEPVERASKTQGSSGGVKRGLARDLLDADPDDLRADGGRERVWIADGRQRGHGGPSVIHYDRECYRLGLSPEIVETTRDELAATIDWSDCPACVDEEGERRSGLARDLLDADPDDLRADGGEDRFEKEGIGAREIDAHVRVDTPGSDADTLIRGSSDAVDHVHVGSSHGLAHLVLATEDDRLSIQGKFDADEAMALAGGLYDAALCARADEDADVVLMDDLADDDLRADGGAYPCALCNETHESLEAALRCCGEKLQIPADFADDLWTCDRCGEFATERCRGDDGDYCLWCRQRVDDRQRREADGEREVRPDGGRGTCSHCGATLPEEIDEGTGVYCTECGHGQLVTDGGGSRHPDDQRIIDAMERQADALERLADEQRYQSAALTELVGQLDEVAAAVDDFHQEPRENARRSNRALQTILEDHDHERREAADDVRRKLPDGGRSMHPTIVPCGNCLDPTPVGELVDGPDGRAVCPPCGRGEGHREDVRTDGGTTVPDPDGGAFDHPVRVGAIVRRLHESEGTEVLLEVLGRFKHLDDDHIEYRLTCPTRSGYYRYRDEDLDDCFVDTGLTNDESRKAIGDSEIRALYQHLHDEHDEHSFTEVVDPDSGETWQQCLHCGQDESDSLVTDGGRSDLDQQLGSLLEAWYTRDVPAYRCRFCNEQLFEPVDDPAEQFCDCDCADAFETVLDARIALGNRDLHQRGYD